MQKGETPEEIVKREGRFLREVSMLSKVQHKNLVKVSQQYFSYYSFLGICISNGKICKIAIIYLGRRKTALEQQNETCFAVPVVICSLSAHVRKTLLEQQITTRAKTRKNQY